MGHQHTGKTSTIRCLTRSIVLVTLPGGGKCYGKLKGMYDDGRYEVELIGSTEWTQPVASSESKWGEEEYREGDCDEGNCWGQCVTERTVMCWENEIEMCGVGMGIDQHPDRRPEEVHWDGAARPSSTIGIDIDMWKPAITYDLLKKKSQLGMQCSFPEPMHANDVVEREGFGRFGLKKPCVIT